MKHVTFLIIFLTLITSACYSDEEDNTELYTSESSIPSLDEVTHWLYYIDVNLEDDTVDQILESTYDMVVIDSSTVLAVADVRILSRLAHKVVFLIRWSDTRRDVAMSGLRQLIDAGGDVAGVVLSMVDVEKHSHYGYGGAGYYYGRISKYYTG